MANYKIENWVSPQVPGQAGLKITWTGGRPAPATTKLVISDSNPAYYYGGMASNDPNAPVSGWIQWSNYPNTQNSAQFPAPLSTPLYVLPRYIAPQNVSNNGWGAYNQINLNSDGSQGTCVANADPTAGITITMIGVGGGGPEEDV